MAPAGVFFLLYTPPRSVNTIYCVLGSIEAPLVIGFAEGTRFDDIG